jgi:hypothetical protein
MSKNRIVHRHQLLVTFEQGEDNNVSWGAEPDEAIVKTEQVSMEDLAKAGAPLAALGIRALWEIVANDTITTALDRGNMQLWREIFRQMNEDNDAVPDSAESESVHDFVEGVVIH